MADWMTSWWVIVLAVSAVYLFIVQPLLRWKRWYRLSKLTDEQAIAQFREISFDMAFLEFPFIVTTSLEQGILRTFAIPTIAETLHQTRQFENKPEKRDEDTDLLVREFTEFPLDSARAQQAIQRLNHIHSLYNISNEDYIYVSYVFTCVPCDWIDKWSWRKCTRAERLAQYEAWRRISEQMGMKDYPTSMEALRKYGLDYERDHFAPTDAARLMTDSTLAMAMRLIPAPLACMRPFVSRFSVSIFDAELLEAIGRPPATKWMAAVFWALMQLRRGFLRFLSLPRPRFLAKTRLRGSGDDDVNAVYKPRFKRYYSDYIKKGYVISSIGPKVAKAGELKSYGCPFSGAAAAAGAGAADNPHVELAQPQTETETENA